MHQPYRIPHSRNEGNNKLRFFRFRDISFFDGCLLKGDSRCSGDLAIAFSSENIGYEKLIVDTVSVFVADASHSFIEGTPLSIDLELRDKSKYKHHHLGEINLSRSDSANFKLRGHVTRSGAASQVIRADIEYRIKRESGPVWFE